MNVRFEDSQLRLRLGAAEMKSFLQSGECVRDWVLGSTPLQLSFRLLIANQFSPSFDQSSNGLIIQIEIPRVDVEDLLGKGLAGESRKTLCHSYFLESSVANGIRQIDFELDAFSAKKELQGGR